MPVFEKEIVTEGMYVTGDGKGGRQVSVVDRNRMNHWVSQHTKMIESGLKIPGPEAHIEKFKPVNPEKEPEKAEDIIGSKSNYGFWKKLWVDDATDNEGNEVKVLKGLIDVEHETDADIVGTKVQETSIFGENFVDGDGVLWEDSLAHIALVTKPIEKGQKNFVRVDDDQYSISMSHRLPIVMDQVILNSLSPEGNVNTDDLYELLEKVAGVAIPKETSTVDLPVALKLALQQKHLSEQRRKGGTVTDPPNNSQVNEVPVVMSNNQTQTAAKTTSTAAPKTPETSPVQTEESIRMSHLENRNNGLMTLLLGTKQKELKGRLQVLKDRGIITDDDLFKNLNEQVGTVQMAFDEDSNPIPSNLEVKIEAWEAVKVPMPTDTPMIAMANAGEGGNYTIQKQPLPASNEAMTNERADEIVNNLMGEVKTV